MARPALTAVLMLGLLSSSALADTVQVAVAANLQYAFADLAAAFTQQSGHQLQGSFNSSGKFHAQISNGAPFAVFLSADADFPQQLYQAGHGLLPPKIYAYGKLVLWAAKGQALGKWPAALQAAGVQRIAIANPQTAPYGREALRAIEHAGLGPALAGKLVHGGSIGQVNQYLSSGAVQLAFTAQSVVLAAGAQGQGQWLEVPVDAYLPLKQAVILLKPASKQPAARQFYDFLDSPRARQILQRYGYQTP